MSTVDPPPGEESVPEAPVPPVPLRSRAHRWARGLLALWTISFLVVACGPVVLLGAIGSASGGATGGAISLTLTTVLFVPWLVGFLVLGALVVLTRV